MRLRSVSMRKWTLWGALPLAIVNPFHAAITALGMTLWMLLGLMLPDRHLSPYQRRIGPWREGARAFLALSVGVFVLTVMEAFAHGTGIYGSLLGNVFAFGIPFFAQFVTSFVQLNHISPRIAALYGCSLTGLFFLLL